MCGIDNKTYSNKCLLDQADVSLQYQGECKSSVCICPLIL